MRRNDKEINDKSIIEDILSSNNHCRIALAKDNFPYIVIMNYGYFNGYLYFHSSGKGMKLDILKTNSNICYEISDSIEVGKSNIACNFSMKYRSVIGQGRVEIIKDLEDKRIGISAIMNQLTDKANWDIPDNSLVKLTMFKVRTENITGKISE